MKQFITALLAVAASATDYFEGITVQNALEADKVKTVLIKDSADTEIWSIETESYFEEDTGDRWLRVTHYLTANIHADDVVTFDISFQSSYDPWTDPTNIIEDSGRCTVEMDADDNRFWTTTVTDYFWYCADVACSNSALSATTWYTGSFTESEDDVNDWEVAIVDDNPNDRWCTPMQPVAVVDSAAPTYEEY